MAKLYNEGRVGQRGRDMDGLGPVAWRGSKWMWLGLGDAAMHGKLMSFRFFWIVELLSTLAWGLLP